MVEVDVFWSYGLGASFAMSAFRQLRKLQAEGGAEDFELNRAQSRSLGRLIKKFESGDTVFNNEYFVKTLASLACLFVPAGANLLWSNPSWETMHVGSYETIPAWLVSGFTITNITQGILGYWVTYNYLMEGKYHEAARQTFLAYLAFFFILVNGWDKTGYRRFFSKNRAAFEDWKPSNVFGYLGSDVVRIFLAYGAAYAPLMLYWVGRWVQEGFDMEEGLVRPIAEKERRAERWSVNARILGSTLGLTLGWAIIAHLLIRFLGWTIGGAAAAAIAHFGFGKRGIGPALLKSTLKLDKIEGPPVWELALSLPAVEELEKTQA